jgi:hypothetical protein
MFGRVMNLLNIFKKSIDHTSARGAGMEWGIDRKFTGIGPYFRPRRGKKKEKLSCRAGF